MKIECFTITLVFYLGIEQSNETEWNRLWELYLNEQNPQEKQRMMEALCYTKDPAIIQRFVLNSNSRLFRFLLVYLIDNELLFAGTCSLVRTSRTYDLRIISH